MARPNVIVRGASPRHAPRRWAGFCDLAVTVEPVADGYEAWVSLEHEPGDPDSAAVLAAGEPGRTKREAIGHALARLARLGAALLNVAGREEPHDAEEVPCSP